MSKIKKSAKILLVFILIIAVLIVIAFMSYYLYASQVRFDYCDRTIQVLSDDYNMDIWLKEHGYIISYPLFGNSASLEEYGDAKSYPFGFIGEKNEPVYQAINFPLAQYATQLVDQYENRVKVDYEVYNNGKTLTVFLNGTAYPVDVNGEEVIIDREFVFDIEKASTNNIPTQIK